jgi:hypothetical protein
MDMSAPPKAGARTRVCSPRMPDDENTNTPLRPPRELVTYAEKNPPGAFLHRGETAT